ncbi:MAG TPA: hypothetical protein VGI21_16965 [Streptosporangiaceae bacterium]|jgi:hypothetical protein
MPVPGSGDVQFDLGKGKLTVDEVTDPNGPPANVLDIDLGFDISGTVSLPNWLRGKGKVCVYAHELGGSVNKSIGCADVDFSNSPPGEPKAVRKDWKVIIPPDANPPVLPDPQPDGSQVYNLVAVFTFGGQQTDIAAFVDIGTYLIN